MLWWKLDRKPMHKMNLTCLSTSDPGAMRAEMLHNHSAAGSLWTGHGSLRPCLSTSPPAPSSCEVCTTNGTVHAVCRELLSRANLELEGEGLSFGLTESECPGLLRETVDWMWLWVLAGVVILPLLCFLIWKLIRKRQRTRREQDGETIPGEVQMKEGAANGIKV